MNNITTEIIKKDYEINRVIIPSSQIISAVYKEGKETISSNDFKNTLLINNRSNTFIKNTNFDYQNGIETNIDIININESKIDGKYITVNNLNNTFSVNLNNSQATFKNSNIILNSRTDDQSFFNFPVPKDSENFAIQPMMISNGERTIWSEGKYGWLNTEKIDTFAKFKSHAPHDLNGQTIELNIQEHLGDIKNYHNGTIIFKGQLTTDKITISDCSIKIILKEFNFKHLNIINCNTVYLEDCSFENDLNSLNIDLNTNINPFLFKQGKVNNINNTCLSASNSKIFIKNKNKNLTFTNFFYGIVANNNSEIYMIPENDDIKLVLIENLSNYKENINNRPIFMLAYNGSIINCNYNRKNGDDLVNLINVKITYPINTNYIYKGDNGTFNINTDQMFIQNNNTRMKSLLFSLISQHNNGRINCSLKRENQAVYQTEQISIPPFGLYQVAEPKSSSWQTLANNSYHILRGNNSDQYYLNVYTNGEIRKNCNYFPNYNGLTNYLASQPHLAHYKDSRTKNVEMVCSNASNATTIEEASNIKESRLNQTIFKMKE